MSHKKKITTGVYFNKFSNIGKDLVYETKTKPVLWVKSNKKASIACLRGLIETDGSIYIDRGYKMVNFVSIIENLAKDVLSIIKKLGFSPKIYKIKKGNAYRYNIRVSIEVEKFIKIVKPNKS